MGYKRIKIIVNPAAGKEEPVLARLNAAFQNQGIDWDIAITKESGDGRRFAGEAADEGYDLVAVYGGDGSVMEAAAGLMGGKIPLAILPGGTANVMSVELGIPGQLDEACELILDPDASLRRIDMGATGDTHFILRASAGFEAKMIADADRGMKDRIGVLAYGASALQALREIKPSRYRLTLDGDEQELEGVNCVIANSGSLGIRGLSLSPQVSVTDGLLDVFVFRKADLESILSIAASALGTVDQFDNLQHFQVKSATVEAEPAQSVQIDGEIAGETPVSAEVIPQAITILVPGRPDGEQ